jgi:hypothetical protein
MPLTSITSVFERAGVATPDEFATSRKAWGVAVENGSADTWLAFLARERGLTEEILLQRLSQTLNWPFLDLARLGVPAEAQQKISTKVAFQHFVLPTRFENGALQVAVSNPFDSAMLNAVRFDARCPVEFALAPRMEIEKALKKYYGVGAETLDELAEDEPIDLLVGTDKEITESDQEASVIKFVNQIIWEAFKDRATTFTWNRWTNSAYPLSHRRHSASDADAAAAETLSSRHHFPHQGHVRDEHRRKTPAPGRPHQRAHQGRGNRHPRFHRAHGLWRKRFAAAADRGKIFLSLDKLGFAPADEQAIREVDHSQAARHFAGHRSDRLGEIDLALRVASEHDQFGAKTDHHRRGTGRIRA